MRLRLSYRSASLWLKLEPTGAVQLYSLLADHPGRGDAGALIRSTVALFKHRHIVLHVEPFGHQTMNIDELRAFYRRVGFTVDAPRGWMWCYAQEEPATCEVAG